MKKNDSLPGFRESSIAGMIAPSRLPRCGLPLLCIPVSILAIILQIKERKRVQMRLILRLADMRIAPLIVLLTASCLFAQQAEPLLFNEKIHDFGTIREDAGPADFEFTFTNNSGLAVTVVSVQASCGCTTPGWTKEP